MENLWIKAHEFILESKCGDYYMDGDNKISVIRRTPKKIYLSNKKLITIKKSEFGFYYLSGKYVEQILRDIEGYFVFLKHDPLLQ